MPCHTVGVCVRVLHTSTFINPSSIIDVHCIFHSVIPAPAVKELIIPLIKKNNWRMKEKLNKKENENGVSNKEDDEAASAILKGTCMNKSRKCTELDL